MGRPSQGLVKVTLRLSEGDFEVLKKFYGCRHGHMNKAFRQIIHKHCLELEEALAKQIGNVDVFFDGSDVAFADECES